MSIPCPLCGSPMAPRQGPKARFYGCLTYPRCRGVRWTDDPLVRVEESKPRVVATLPGQLDLFDADADANDDKEEEEDEHVALPQDIERAALLDLHGMFKEASNEGLKNILELLLLEASERGFDLYEDYK